MIATLGSGRGVVRMSGLHPRAPRLPRDGTLLFSVRACRDAATAVAVAARPGPAAPGAFTAPACGRPADAAMRLLSACALAATRRPRPASRPPRPPCWPAGPHLRRPQQARSQQQLAALRHTEEQGLLAGRAAKGAGDHSRLREAAPSHYRPSRHPSHRPPPLVPLNPPEVHFHHHNRTGYRLLVSNPDYPVDLLRYRCGGRRRVPAAAVPCARTGAVGRPARPPDGWAPERPAAAAAGGGAGGAWRPREAATGTGRCALAPTIPTAAATTLQPHARTCPGQPGCSARVMTRWPYDQTRVPWSAGLQWACHDASCPISPQTLVAVMGCIPLVISDSVMQPFEPELPWAQFSMRIAHVRAPPGRGREGGTAGQRRAAGCGNRPGLAARPERPSPSRPSRPAGRHPHPSRAACGRQR
jgi:hypothetical protein